MKNSPHCDWICFLRCILNKLPPALYYGLFFVSPILAYVHNGVEKSIGRYLDRITFKEMSYWDKLQYNDRPGSGSTCCGIIIGGI